MRPLRWFGRESQTAHHEGWKCYAAAGYQKPGVERRWMAAVTSPEGETQKGSSFRGGMTAAKRWCVRNLTRRTTP